MPRRRLPVLVLLLAASTACAESDPATAPGEDAVAAPSTMGDAAESTPPELEIPPVPVEPPPRRLPGADDPMQRCDAEAARAVVLGQEATADVVEQARSLAGADRVRTLAPDQMVTMEYHPSRLNLIVDGSNVIVEVRCG